VARVLTNAGARCGHEQVFGPRTRAVPHLDTWQCDASWLAAPFLADLPAGTVVLHQVRNPVDVVSSWYGLRFLSRSGPYSFRRPSGLPRLLWHEAKTRSQRARGHNIYVARDYERFVARHAPTVLEGTTTLERCVRYWVAWNELVAGAAGCEHLIYHRYRVEDMAREWPTILALLELPEDQPFAGGSPDANTRRRHDELASAELRGSPSFGALVTLARSYGYDEASPS
jgi:hypothetical protein